jgi:hypothetical protein
MKKKRRRRGRGSRGRRGKENGRKIVLYSVIAAGTDIGPFTITTLLLKVF